MQEHDRLAQQTEVPPKMVGEERQYLAATHYGGDEAGGVREKDVA